MGKKEKHENPLIEALDRLVALERETDRASLLIGAEILNDTLERILRAKFTAVGLDEDRMNRLLGGFMSPLYPFALRILFCRAFGVLPSGICDLLDHIRDMRNHCAHRARVVTLQDSGMAAGVRALQEYVKHKRNLKRTPKPRSAINKGIVDLNDNLRDYRKALTEKKPPLPPSDTPPNEPQ